jgi:hypothetical protein
MPNQKNARRPTRKRKIQAPARLTRNDKTVLKRARILPRKTTRPRKESNHESPKE